MNEIDKLELFIRNQFVRFKQGKRYGIFRQ